MHACYVEIKVRAINLAWGRKTQKPFSKMTLDQDLAKKQICHVDS